VSAPQNAGQNRNTEMANASFQNAAKFRYLGTIAENQTLVHEEIKSNSGNASNRSVHNLLSSHLLSKNVKIKTYKSTVFRVVLYGWDL
jgi:hypothetical protein